MGATPAAQTDHCDARDVICVDATADANQLFGRRLRLAKHHHDVM